MSDLIDRQQAIDALKHNQDIYSHNFHDDPIDKYTTAIIATDIDTLVKLPTIQPEPKWIPVSERLPEEYGNYLISIHGEDEPDIGTINPNDKRGWSLCDANGFYWASDKKLTVTAWMPLPTPYTK